ncbi:MAG: HAD family phosphatase [Lachnospiraceae bacterium]|nr:HAD family phosphatase [Lachnospiraceae bacterium]
MKKYKNIVFDVGGVLLEYRWRDMLTVDYNMDPSYVETFADHMFDNDLWNELDLANMSLSEVVEAYVERYPQDEAAIRWFMGHNELMSVARPKVWEEVKHLKKEGYHIYLLSNYNKEFLDNHTRGASFWEAVDGQVISYEVHAIKPYPPIYKALFDRYHLKPKECLFFDDRADNVEGSKAVGMDAIRVLSQEQLIEEIRKLL